MSGGGLEPRLAFRGNPDQIFNDFRVPLGFHFGSLWCDFFLFFHCCFASGLGYVFFFRFGRLPGAKINDFWLDKC